MRLFPKVEVILSRASQNPLKIKKKDHAELFDDRGAFKVKIRRLFLEVVLLSRPRFFALFMIDILFSNDQPKLFIITLFII